MAAAIAALALVTAGCGGDSPPTGAFERQEARVGAELEAQRAALGPEARAAIARADGVAAATTDRLEDQLAAIVTGAAADTGLDLDRSVRTAIDQAVDVAMLEAVAAYEAERDGARAAGAADPPIDAARDGAADRIRDVADAAQAEVDALEADRRAGLSG